MRCLGLDLGTKTLGIAISDKLGMIANPYKTLKFKNYDELVPILNEIIKENDIAEIALGLPKNMDNSLGFASKRSIEFKEFLEEKLDIDIVLIDERL